MSLFCSHICCILPIAAMAFSGSAAAQQHQLGYTGLVYDFEDGLQRGWQANTINARQTVVPGWGRYDSQGFAITSPHSREGETGFGFQIVNSSDPSWLGDLTRYGDFEFSVDVFTWAFGPAGVPNGQGQLVIEFMDTDSPPGNYPYVSVYAVLGEISAAQRSASPDGWVRYSVFCPAVSAGDSLPAGWGGTGDEDERAVPRLPRGRTFQSVLQSVDRVRISSFVPGLVFLPIEYDLQIDNIAINPADIIVLDEQPEPISQVASTQAATELAAKLEGLQPLERETQQVVVKAPAAAVGLGGDTSTTTLNVSNADGKGPTFVFRLPPNPPEGAAQLLQEVGQLYSGLYQDDVTLVIDVSFSPENIGFGVGNAYVDVPMELLQDLFAADADADDPVQGSLQHYIFVDRFINNERTTVISGAVVSRPVFKALGFDVSGLPDPWNGADGELVLGTQDGGFLDYTLTPENGIEPGKYSAKDLIARGLAAVMGFESMIVGPASAGPFAETGLLPSVFDMFRFAEQTPTNAQEFVDFHRVFDVTAPARSRIFFSDTKTAVPLENDSIWRAGHWLTQEGTDHGMMVPAILPGQTRAPQFLGANDIAALDAIGWDYVLPLGCSDADIAAPYGQVNQADVDAMTTSPVPTLALPEEIADFMDFAVFLKVADKGCNNAASR